MKNQLKRLITGIVLFCMMAVVVPVGQMTSWAANTRIAFSDPSVMVGNEVTVNMKITSDSVLGKAEAMLSYDPAILEFVSGTDANGGAGAIKVTGAADAADQKAFTFTLKFKALAAGTTQIAVTSQEIYDADSQIVTVDQQGTSAVKVTSPATSSKDAALSSLKISPGVLTPEFSAEVENYTAEVNGSTASLVVNAVAANAGASVTLEGADNLQVGENQVVIRVTAEDRETVKTYTIAVNKLEGETEAAGGEVTAEFSDATVTIGDMTYSVAASFDGASLPSGFEASTYNYKGNEIMAGKGTGKDLLLLYLQDESGNGGFYLYQEDTDSFSEYVMLEVNAKSVEIVPLGADVTVPDGFVERQIEIDGKRVTGWVDSTEADPQSCLFYGMNENGEKHFYRYDLSEMTVQRFFASGVSNAEYARMVKLYEDIRKDYNLQFYMLIGVGVLSVILLIVIIILLKRGGGKPEPRGRRFREEEEEYGRAEGGRVRRTLDDDLKEAIYLEDAQDEESETDDSDDFMVESSLEDMEQQLRNRLAKEASQTRAAAPKAADVRKPAPQDEDEDDFEIMDLED